ncbi:Acb2/Tad1 domain-containing protein, partial [Klebsiella pneumoniae]|uniref:Acb2/Tad1 domain-containing protein n=1 Tax=Klebsiella pneumoniae TaxID=573 RepID=UPI003CC87CBE
TEREVTTAEVVERCSQAETERAEALRCMAIARTKMQEACMWACSAVARPDADC